MGGKAVDGRRLSREEYFSLSGAVARRLKSVIPEFTIPKVLPSKESFGDIDILVGVSDLPNGWMDRAMMAMGGSGMVHANRRDFARDKVYEKGEAFSCTVSGAQVDLIAHSSANLAYASRWYNYGDLSNFLGLTARSLGLTYHYSGIYITHEIVPGQNRPILVTDDFDMGLRILGYDPIAHQEGFADEKALYEWVLSSKYFDIAQTESRNSGQRRRDQVREQFLRFKEYALANARPPVEIDLDDVRSGLQIMFPDYLARIKSEESEYEFNLMSKLRVNGGWIKKELGIQQGAEIGQILGKMKRQFSTPAEFDVWVVAASNQDLLDALHEAAESIFDREPTY
jgi:hypothetical protein